MSSVIRTCSYCAAVGLTAIHAPVHAGAWTPKEGSAYHKFALNTFYSDSSFGAQPPGLLEFTDRNFTYYVEYGIVDSLAFFGSLPAKRLESRTTNGTVSTSGVGDVDLGLRWRLHQSGPIVISASFLFKAPYLYDERDPIPLGNGQEDLETRLQLGRSLGRFGYFGIEAGLRYRAGAPADEFRYLLEYGFDASPNVYLRTKLDGIKGLRNSSSAASTPGNPTLNLEFDLAKLELTGGLKFSPSVAGELTATRNLYGTNTLRGTNYSFALVFAY